VVRTKFVEQVADVPFVLLPVDVVERFVHGDELGQLEPFDEENAQQERRDVLDATTKRVGGRSYNVSLPDEESVGDAASAFFLVNDQPKGRIVKGNTQARRGDGLNCPESVGAENLDTAIDKANRFDQLGLVRFKLDDLPL
jgi:hypothetical protein